jgi:predicted nucleic acid-binding Zn ribbon protein
MRKREAQSLNDILGESLRSLKIDGKLNETRLMEAWPSVVGSGITNHTKSLYVSRRILYVQMDSAVIRHELQMMRQSLMEHLNKAAGSETIKDIIFR